MRALARSPATAGHRILHGGGELLQESVILTSAWDWRLVAFSYGLAALASYAALDLADRVLRSGGVTARRLWLAGGAGVMGLGIWSMHFTGMLAYDFSMPVTYGAYLTLLSALVAVVASGAALFAVSRRLVNARRLLLGGVILGLGIVSMHYLGMEAMRMPAEMGYYPPLVALSVAIAVGASLAALALVVRFDRQENRRGARRNALAVRAGGSLVLGAAIAGMHYTGMAAVRLEAAGMEGMETAGGALVDRVALGVAVGGAASVILCVALVSAMVDRRFSRQAGELAETEALYSSLFEQSVDALLVHDPEGNIVDCNSEACRSLGYPRERLLGMNISHIATNLRDQDSESPDGVSLWQRAILSEPGQVAGVHEGEHVHSDGTRFPVEVRVGPVDYRGERMILAAARDVTERKRLERELEHRAYHDELTGLPNRALFSLHLERAIARSRDRGSLAVLFLDLDNFKFVNDSLSHEAGDRLLVEVAGRLRSCLRRTDSAARLGGDEFTVLVEAADGVERATAVAERISQALERSFVVDGRELLATFSIGIALSEGGEDSPEELLRRADTAMYRAKEGGRARYEVFESDMNNRALERLELETDLRRAVERDEIEVHYQPKVVVRTGEIYGVEALARWNHPERGLVSPGEFIQVAEETGAISAIGERVLERACMQARLWQRRHGGIPRTVCVNLSARQLRSPGLVGSVRDILARSGLAPGSLVLEITETAVVDDTRANAELLRALKDLGVRLAVDDFGKGYSSLAYLKRLPVDMLKIDRTFVSGSGDDGPDEVPDVMLVEAIMSFARALGLTVTAEGVESAEQLAGLRRMGCDLAQGYHLSRPLPPSGLERLLEAGLPLSGLQSVESAQSIQSIQSAPPGAG